MKVIKNPDKEIADEVTKKLKANDGYCPCRLKRTPETKCMCAEFRGQIADPDWFGECHCGLYVKVL